TRRHQYGSLSGKTVVEVFPVDYVRRLSPRDRDSKGRPHASNMTRHSTQIQKCSARHFWTISDRREVGGSVKDPRLSLNTGQCRVLTALNVGGRFILLSFGIALFLGPP